MESVGVHGGGVRPNIEGMEGGGDWVVVGILLLYYYTGVKLPRITANLLFSPFPHFEKNHFQY